jgi:hypothetical protein
MKILIYLCLKALTSTVTAPSAEAPRLTATQHTVIADWSSLRWTPRALDSNLFSPPLSDTLGQTL